MSLWWWTVDHKLMGLITLLIIGGVSINVCWTSSCTAGLNEYHFLRNKILFCISIPLMIIISIQKFYLKRFCLLILFFSFICLIYLNFFGIETNGATRWIRIFGISIQPSELLKPSFVLVNAWLLSIWVNDKNNQSWTFSLFIFFMLLVLLLLQPDVGMSFILASTWFFQIYYIQTYIVWTSYYIMYTSLFYMFIIFYYFFSHTKIYYKWFQIII